MATISDAQKKALAAFAGGETLSSYRARTSLATCRALVKKGLLMDVTKHGPGGMFSPQTHYQFKATEAALALARANK